ncbi:MAG: glutaminyl-tRNA synthase (glutamine-hydrolyzing) subunit A [Candidatus Staskawiczbacteria bacterium RIFCSPHIGHO2_02_FULL_34_10]|uniref:Glutamyl-tRNA(Gln) amidotransferase subunit A n=2 Tax=Candidatus Staskawicziibacteriota TaxID=1817916 RepID=A0A1G2HJF7_9BACT|nr:MAG: glutaminyl-tRNA synthase (glutamine-hydrolyzing) subunit A [Candidatus Staskawiczbacteria bacterium RIFCSPHIGHO2_01_FULL_34_27]OGZ66377.1 MAG: glutaminyl-tRNA synthase (glutamine-hydrolyzing) subunit A [Candidatus Staskawiczbacteria bacterium RIFCSPHIGHO2_02_FULL_34_10]
MNILDLTITQLHEGFRNKNFTSVEVTKAYLENIKKTDKEIGAYLLVTEGLALNQAEKADKLISLALSGVEGNGGDFPLLMGVPFSVKDAILVEGQKATAGSKILENYVAPYDATVIKKLKTQGAVILGKTNLDEFAMGVSTENSAFKVTKNPNDLTRVSGGSSGGSAASVAAKQAVYSLGSDTGGSIRLPASFCGVVGLNPTYGAVSRSGLISMASSLDQIGPITKTVEDCRIVFDAIKGKDPLDATSIESQISNFKSEIKNIKIGVPKEYFGRGINSNVKKIIEDAIKKAKKHGAKIVPISLPNSKYAVACYYIIVPSEVSANLARFDGIKYGLYEDAENLLDGYMKTRGRGFGIEVKRRIMLGTYSLSSGYYDAYYKKAQEVRQIIKEDFIDAFKKVDLIFSPVSPIPAFKIGEKTDDALSMYLMDIYTCPVKLAGLPAISLPVGNIGKLPVGLQIIGKYFEENKIFNIASQLEKML